MEFPESVEEAAALLGASITKASLDKNDPSPRKVKPPPTGMHPAFAIHETSPLLDLMERLYVLRALLRSATTPIPSAASILQVLKKILGLSIDVASVRSNDRPTPPLMSNALRKLWVDCVLLCCQEPQNSLAWIPAMQAVASTHPRSAKASGGVRIAALQVLHGLKASPDVRAALRSAGAGEPTFRIAAVHSALFVDDLEEGFRILKLAATDKFPEVRYGAAKLAAAKIISEDTLNLALRNIDDEQPFVALAWAQAASQCIWKLAGKKKGGQALPWLSSQKAAMEYCVEQFIKVGGELAAQRAGGTFSLGGRSVRLGYALIIIDLVKFDKERSLEELGDLLKRILRMVDIPDDPKQRLWSSFDTGLVRLFCGRVLREGLAEQAGESDQVSLMQELFMLLQAEATTAQQKQVILTELSHLVVTLCEATYAIVQENLQSMNTALADASRGVRFDAAMLVSSIGTTHPDIGRALVRSCLAEIKEQYDMLLKAAFSDIKGPDEKEGRGLFRRQQKKAKANVALLRPHQAAIHGHALAVSLLLQDLPRSDGGLSRSTMDGVLDTATILVNSHFDERLGVASTEASFTCVRAGYTMICGLMSTGPQGAEAYVKRALDMWQKTVKATTTGLPHMKPADDLICLDAALTSMVVFLKHCSELILVIPEALNQVTVLLETIFPALDGPGRLAKVENSPRLDSAVASLLEAFAWLPSGSFPLAADKVFSMASSRIEKAVEENVPCSILYSLISREDSILDAKTLPRACREGQTGGARKIEDSIVSINADIIPQSDQESVMHLRSHPIIRVLGEDEACFRKSRLLRMFSCDDTNVSKPPTPLHEVGTWREPIDPSSSAKVRTLDAAIQAFSATFGLKDGKQQQGAMDMLERLVPPFFAQLARTIGINSATMEVERRTKTRDDDSAAVANITAVVLCCLQALPLHEATHNVPISLGPPWMNKAKDLLLTLLPSTSTIVRRAAAEGLALLATLGVTEDAHFMQSTVLHSLDEVMQGNKPDGKARTLLALESISAAKSGSLLALACMQRTAHNVATRKKARARGRVSGSMTEKMIGKVNEDLPVLQMLTRILPSASCHEFRDYFVVKTYALHSFAVLLTYSARLNSEDLQEEDKHLIRKGVELVVDNFFEAWTSVSADSDRGQETEKVATEAAFLAVIIRLMTLLLPFLPKIDSTRKIAMDFATMTSIALEIHGQHPVVFVEGMAFFEVIHGCTPPPEVLSRSVQYTEHPMLSFLPPAISALKAPLQPEPMSLVLNEPTNNLSYLPCRATRASVFVTKLLIDAKFPITTACDMEIVESLFAATEHTCGSRTFKDGRNLRLLTEENTATESDALASELCNAMGSLVTWGKCDAPILIRWILLSRHLLMPFATSESEEDDDSTTTAIHKRVAKAAQLQAITDTSFLQNARSQFRWQTRCLASQVLAESVDKLRCSELKNCNSLRLSSQFDTVAALKVCQSEFDSTSIVFHLEDLLLVAFKTSSASIEQSELKSLQTCSARLLASLIQSFGPTQDPDDVERTILDQFLPQIMTSLRLAFPTSDSNESGGASANAPLLVAGCEAINHLFLSEINLDETTLKRLKTLTFSDHFASNEVQLPGEFKIMTPQGKMLAGFVAKIWVVSGLLSKGCSDDNRSECYGVAMASSCCAIDACLLLDNSALTLTGQERPGDSEETSEMTSRGFLFSNSNDIDCYARSTIVEVWSSCAKHAALIFEKLRSDHDNATGEWLNLLGPLCIQGIYDSVDDLRNHATMRKCGWASGLNADSVLLDCIYALTALLQRQQSLESELASVCCVVFDRIIQNQHQLIDIPEEVSNGARTLLETFCSVDWISENSVDCLVSRFLEPLHLLEKDELKLSQPEEQRAVGACFGCIKSLIENGKTSQISTLLLLIQKRLLTPDIPAALERDVLGLFQCCMEKACVSLQQSVARSLVEQHSWQAWARSTIVCDPSALTESLSGMQSKLRSDDPLPALLTIQMADETVQDSLGADVVQLMYEMGTRDNSDQKVFAAALKILLSIYSRLVDIPDNLVAFLTVVFEALIAIIRFNGLPNYPAKGDTTLGQMSTKTIVHVARTTPTEFKDCLLTLTAESKTLLEFSVRADMNDYAVATVKKKLDLKGFRK